jgi:TonB family protein
MRITGSGILRLSLNERGKVTAVKIVKSTGNKELDDEGVRTMSRWRAKPGPPREINVPLNFSLGDGKSAGPTPTPQQHDGLGIMKGRDR